MDLATMNLDLRPLTVSEFLDRAFSIYRHRFLLFVGLMAPQAVLSLAAALLWGVIIAPFQNDAVPDTPMGLLVGGVIGIVVFTVFHWVLYVLGAGATVAAVSDLYGRMRPEMGTAFAAARARVGSLLWMTFLMALRLGGVMLAFLSVPLALLVAAGVGEPGRTPSALAIAGFVALMFAMLAAMVLIVWMALRYAVGIPAVMLEPIGGGAALARSVALTRGLLGRTFLLMICTTMVAYAMMMVLQMPFIVAMVVVGPETQAGFWLNMAGTATGTAGQTLTTPIIAIGVAVLYFEARVRHEALDLQVMTEALAPPPSPPAGFVAAPPPALPQ
jgi:hypothetical protein